LDARLSADLAAFLIEARYAQDVLGGREPRQVETWLGMIYINSSSIIKSRQTAATVATPVENGAKTMSL